MAYSNHRDIRKEAGFYHLRVGEELLTTPDGSTTEFYIDPEYNGDKVKIVPVGTSAYATTSDVTINYGLSGLGLTTIGVTAIDYTQGIVYLTTAPATGSSVTITYASSPIEATEIERHRLSATSTVNNVLSKCFAVPLTTTVSEVEMLTAKLAGAYLLIENYGTNALDSSRDGYRLLDYVLGAEDRQGTGRLFGLCEGNLVDDNGVAIARTDTATVTGSNTVYDPYSSGALFTIKDEPFRFTEKDGDTSSTNSDDSFWSNKGV